MSPEGGRVVRAYRPSQLAVVEQDNEEAEVIRLANLEIYAKRVLAGQPLFEDGEEV